MQIIKITDKLEITAEIWSNSRSWGHEVKAIWNGNEVSKNRVRYYNRTWERYTFETAWLGLLDKLDKESYIPLADRYALAVNLKTR